MVALRTEVEYCQDKKGSWLRIRSECSRCGNFCWRDVPIKSRPQGGYVRDENRGVDVLLGEMCDHMQDVGRQI